MNCIAKQSVFYIPKICQKSFFPILSKPKLYTTHVGSETDSTIGKSKKKDIVPKNILELHERGIFQDIFPPASVTLPDKFKEKQCFYCGFDPTADSLHVGNLLSLMTLLQCQKAGKLNFI